MCKAKLATMAKIAIIATFTLHISLNPCGSALFLTKLV
jgi:hypothetical protein